MACKLIGIFDPKKERKITTDISKETPKVKTIELRWNFLKVMEWKRLSVYENQHPVQRWFKTIFEIDRKGRYTFRQSFMAAQKTMH